jgi:hypothetical protein
MILPGMAGFQPSPTFDARFLQTATPTLPPPCPVVVPEMPLPEVLAQRIAGYHDNFKGDISDDVLEYLNLGGAPEILIHALKAVDPSLIEQFDFTNDGQMELLLKTLNISILGCDPERTAKYIIYGRFIDPQPLPLGPDIQAIHDLNRNGLPELLFTTRAFGGFGSTLFLQVVEWDGRGIYNVPWLSPTYPYQPITFLGVEDEGVYFEPGMVEINDLDGNGTTEIIVHSGIPTHHDTFAHGPWRAGKDIFTWNGEDYVLLYSEIDPPVYRFQAVHDADKAALLGKYDEALKLYQETIFSDKLIGWSLELYLQQKDIAATWYNDNPTPTAPPASPEEYNHLAAYAHFRILVLHSLQGNITEAQTVYDTLHSEFPQGQPGFASALFGQYFWHAFQDTQDVAQACNLALESMGEQTEEIIYWLRDIHGWQAPRYLPIDLCPFRYTGTP